jgi:hypothetical protein
MRDELETQGQWQRLVELYRAMSDGELLGLAERPRDLTEMAQGVLRNEMGSRRLQVEAGSAAEAGFGVAAGRYAEAGSNAGVEFYTRAQREPEMRPEPVAKGLAKGTVVLTTFRDAISAGEACNYLEAEGMEIDVRDVASSVSRVPPGATVGRTTSIVRAYGGLPVALQIIVQQRELRRAMAILREKMGLFPGQEVEEADEAIDDGTTAVLGAFGHRNDAEDVARVLQEAGIWNRIAANAEGSVEDEDAYTLEVREVDLVRAGEVVERGLGMTEG